MQILGLISFALLILTITIKHAPKSSADVSVESSEHHAAFTPTEIDFVWPAEGIITSHFGPRWGRFHTGIDIAGPRNTPIRAAAAGIVSFVGKSGGYGRTILIHHEDGRQSRYAHLERYLVTLGEEVNAGDKIAFMGSSGSTTGVHLHFEWRDSDHRLLDPLVVLDSARLPFYQMNKRKLFQRMMVQAH